MTTPIAVAGMFGLGLTPVIAGYVRGHFPEFRPMMVSLICFGVFWTAFEFATIAVKPVFDGLINDVVPKPLLGRFYGLFRAVSLIDGMIFNYWIIGHVPTHYMLIMLVIAVFYGSAFMAGLLQDQEGEYPPPPLQDPERPGPVDASLREVRKYFRECFTNPYYVAVFLMLMSAVLTFAPANMYSIPFAHSLGVNMDDYGKAVALTYGISLILAFPLGWLTDMVHPIRTVMGALLGLSDRRPLGRFFATTPRAFLLSNT